MLLLKALLVLLIFVQAIFLLLLTVKELLQKRYSMRYLKLLLMYTISVSEEIIHISSVLLRQVYIMQADLVQIMASHSRIQVAILIKALLKQINLLWELESIYTNLPKNKMPIRGRILQILLIGRMVSVRHYMILRWRFHSTWMVQIVHEQRYNVVQVEDAQLLNGNCLKYTSLKASGGRLRGI